MDETTDKSRASARDTDIMCLECETSPAIELAYYTPDEDNDEFWDEAPMLFTYCANHGQNARSAYEHMKNRHVLFLNEPEYEEILVSLLLQGYEYFKHEEW